MNFETIEGILNINLNSTMTLALAAVLLIMGYSINKRLTILNKILYSCTSCRWILFSCFWLGLDILQEHSNLILRIIFQSTFMLAFFTTVGLGASFALLKKGGNF